MARPRTPSSVLELRGAYKKDPQRRRENEPMPTEGVGTFTERPTSLPEIWDEVVSQLVPGVLTVSDRLALELVCRLLAEIRLHPAEISVGKVTTLCNLLGRFGMTPSDRSKVTVPPPFKENPFLALIGKRTD
jgi:hypothetical protein